MILDSPQNPSCPGAEHKLPLGTSETGLLESVSQWLYISMGQINPVRIVQMNHTRTLCPSFLSTILFLIGVVFTTGCDRRLRIAVIPRTTGVMLWEAEHVGAMAAAKKYGFEIYWNAPTREDDVEGQIALLDRIRNQNFVGLVSRPPIRALR